MFSIAIIFQVCYNPDFDSKMEREASKALREGEFEAFVYYTETRYINRILFGNRCFSWF